MKGMSDERFLAIYENCKTTVFRVAFSYMKSRVDAEDVLQSVFFKLYTKPPKDETNIPAWLAKVTKNECINLLKRKKRESKTIEYVPGLYENLSVYIGEQDGLGILSYVDKLQGNYSSVIKLFYFGGLNVKEIATALGVSENTVKKRLERARNILKTMIEEAQNDRR